MICISDMKDLTVCEPLKDALIAEVDSRFKHLFYDEFHIVATLSDPSFKDYWINDQDYRKHVIEVFSKHERKLRPKDTETDEPKAKVAKTFGKFVPRGMAEENVTDYLSNRSQDLLMLKNFPSIEKLYRKTNTVLASSASVERVFSQAKRVLRDNRSNLSDKNFELQLLLQCNQSFIAQ